MREKGSDAPDFKEATRVPVATMITTASARLAGLVSTSQQKAIPDLMVGLTDGLNTAFQGGKFEDVRSKEYRPGTINPDAWTGPQEGPLLEGDFFAKLFDKFFKKEIDESSLAKRAYMLQILLHKYQNANGRVARAIETICGSMGRALAVEPNSPEMDYILGTGTTRNSWFIRPDFLRIPNGAMLFTLQNGVDYNKLHDGKPVFAEKAICMLAKELEIDTEECKRRFINYMVIDSDLGYWDAHKNP